MDTATLLCSCSDKTGIVASLTNFVAEYGGNILDLDQHTDTANSSFFMRIVWSMQGFALSRQEIPSAMEIVAKKFDDMKWQVFFTTPKPKVIIFASKAPHCLADLLLRYQMGELNADISCIISNHNTLRHLAESYDIPFFHTPQLGKDKQSLETVQLDLLEKKQPDLIVLARYMQILSEKFVERWQGKIINIHHSFLPAFIGAKPYHQAKARGVKLIGATAHYVTADLDQGPIIAQDVTTVTHRDEVEDLIRKGRDIERQVLGKAVRAHLENKVIISANRTVIFN